jgi:hypothetical protein
MSQPNLEALHKLCFRNKTALASCTEAGCFYCKRVVDPATIKEWVDAESDTALCPHCGVDSVLPGVTDSEILKQMRIRWFSIPRPPK